MRLARSVFSSFSMAALTFGPLSGSSSRATKSWRDPSRYRAGTTVALSDVELAT